MSETVGVSEIMEKKALAYDLLQKVYTTAGEMKRLQEQLAQVETEIAELEKENV